MTVYSLKNSKWPLVPLRAVLLLFIVVFAFYVCSFSMNQISSKHDGRKIMQTSQMTFEERQRNTEVLCSKPSILPQDRRYVHFPKPKTYSRNECSCTPVRFFVIVSMQRSGSGWFETLLNSHPNISSNGEIFNVRERKNNLTSILTTLDKLYNLDWYSSASKNECTAAFGLKWMYNQGLSTYPDELLSYLIDNGVSVIFLFRRNVLRRMVSLLANDYDRKMRPLNGTHKAHVHSREEAEILAEFKPDINVSTLIPEIRKMEESVKDCLDQYRNTRHMTLYYEDIVGNPNALAAVQEFLGVPVRRLVSQHVKIHTRPLPDLVNNFKDLSRTLAGTSYAQFLNNADYG